MAVTYGFFDSVNGDRKYNANQMNEIYKGIVTDGVFQHVDGGLAVSAGTGMTVSVAAGRAIVLNHWVQNSAALTLSISDASSTYARIDAVMLRISLTTRSVEIYVKSGEASASPVAPEVYRSDTTYEMALAYVTVAAGATSVTVTDKRSDSAVCGWVTVAQSTSGEVDAQLNAMKTGFDGVTYQTPVQMVQSCDIINHNETVSLAEILENIPLTQYSETRLASVRIPKDIALKVLPYCWANNGKFRIFAYETDYETEHESANLMICNWTDERDVFITGINTATHKYIGLFFRYYGDQPISLSDFQFGLNWIETRNGFYAPDIELTNYSESRLQTPTLKVSDLPETFFQMWMSDDTNYECILFGSDYENRSYPSQISQWGEPKQYIVYYMMITDKTYIWMYFRNKNDTSAAIYPSELSYGLPDQTDLQKAVERIDNYIQSEPNNFEGKTFAVLCDSIGTHGNTGTWHNVPELVVTAEDVGVELKAYVTYYDLYTNINHDTGEGTFTGLTIGGITLTDSDIGTEITFTPTSDDIGKSLGNVFDWNGNSLKVWWAVMAEHYGMNPIPVCWASSSYSSHENTIKRLIAAHAWHPSQIRKSGTRVPGSMTRIAPDYIILARGCNDMTHTPYDVLTDDFFDDYMFTIPDTDVISAGVFGLKEALAVTIKKMWAAYPNAKIILCTIPYINRINYGNYPTRNNATLWTQWNDAIRETAEFFNCGLIDLAKCGSNPNNIYSYAPDGTHPGAFGHEQMGLKAITDMKKI